MVTITFYDGSHNMVLADFPLQLSIGMNVVTLPDGTTLHVQVVACSYDANQHVLTFWHSTSSWTMCLYSYGGGNTTTEVSPIGLDYCGKDVYKVRIVYAKGDFEGGATTPDAWKNAQLAVIELMQKLKQIQDQNEVVKALQQQHLQLFSGVVKVGEDGKTYIVTDVKKEALTKPERKNEAEYVEL